MSTAVSSLRDAWEDAKKAPSLSLVRTPDMSLGDFSRDAWPILEPGRPFVPNWHLDVIDEHLEAVTQGEIRNLIINMPPRHTKSLKLVLWNAWEWTFAPVIRWLCSSYAQGLSTRDSLKCRRVIESPWYQQRWGKVFQLTGDQNIKTRYDNTQTGYRISTSVGGSATGEGGDRIVVDDPHNVKEAWSETKRTAAIEWWDQVMSTRGNDPKTVSKVVVMQRIHERDLTGHLLEQGGYEHLCLPAEYDGKRRVTVLGPYDPRKKHGELLHPARFGAREIAGIKRELGTYAAAGQLQQQPAPAGGGMIKTDWFRYWSLHGEIPGTIALPQAFDETLQSWDMAFKDLDDSDFVVGQAWGRLGIDAFFLDQSRDHRDFPATLKEVVNFSGRHPTIKLKLVEDKANGTAVVATLKRKITGLVPVDPEGSKPARAAAVSPDIESHHVYLPHPSIASWVPDFLLEVERFPRGANDDQVDAMSQALRRLLGRDEHVRDLDPAHYVTLRR